jgi:hypothetical protein
MTDGTKTRTGIVVYLNALNKRTPIRIRKHGVSHLDPDLPSSEMSAHTMLFIL